jgi:hypothetical protein
MRIFLFPPGPAGLTACAGPQLRGTGDLGLVIERASGRVTLVNTSPRASPMRVSMGSVIFRMPPPFIRAMAATPSSSAAMAG